MTIPVDALMILIRAKEPKTITPAKELTTITAKELMMMMMMMMMKMI